MHNSSIEPNSGYNNSGYDESEPDLTVGYSSSREARQGNFDGAYQENVYDLSNLADTPWTDSAVRPNPQLELELD
ncbi:hypothetical protein QT970_01485 [Microcoleus sp. herbarium8]|uniref:hypothetical protein n=1 Tax=Microcoleus sp. herbarium8 TaxID=3055436 RepID=UPI002FD6ED83